MCKLPYFETLHVYILNDFMSCLETEYIIGIIITHIIRIIIILLL